MSTWRIVQPVSSGGPDPERRGRANCRRLMTGGARAAGQRRAGEDVEGGAEVAEKGEDRVRGGGLLQVEQRRPVGLGVEGGRGHEVAEQADAVDVDGESPAPSTRASEPRGVEAARHGVATPPAPVRAVEDRAGLVELTGERPGQDGGEPPGGDEGGDPAVGQRLGEPVEGGGRVVDVLEGAVAADEVGARRHRARREGSRRRPGRR